MSELPTTAAEIFKMMPERFNASAAADIEAVYQFDLAGDDGGTWQVKIGEGACSVSDGTPDSPSITIAMESQDYVDMIHGKLNPQMAFMGGKLKIKGDMGLALKMQQIFPTA
ncbi:MAG: putative sterol carrier protein [Hyphomicrobiaceae bacterium]|jgi:putative sterol carrier protein